MLDRSQERDQDIEEWEEIGEDGYPVYNLKVNGSAPPALFRNKRVDDSVLSAAAPPHDDVLECLEDGASSSGLGSSAVVRLVLGLRFDAVGSDGSSQREKFLWELHGDLVKALFKAAVMRIKTCGAERPPSVHRWSVS